MTMIMTIVPPVGPPIPVIVGKAIQTNPEENFDVFLDKQFEKDGVYFETDDKTKIFPQNGTLVYQNGTVSEGKIYYGAVDSRNQRKMLHLEDILKEPQLSLDNLKKMNGERKAKRVQKRSLLNDVAKDYTDIIANYFQNPQNCTKKLNCINEHQQNCQAINC